MAIERVLKFKVIEKGQWAYVLWPWETPEGFLYEALQWGATYQLRMPVKLNEKCWLEFVPTEGGHGEYTHNLYFGRLEWGYALYRRFNARGSHYLTQHGLDGIPALMWGQAYEYRSGEPMGNILFQFRIETQQGVFEMSFSDWLHYFVSGRNEHISRMGISITKSKK